MKIIYISENKIYKCENGVPAELTSERVSHYTETIDQINKSKEWKHSGTGAEFMGTAGAANYTQKANISINGIAAGGPGILYSVRLGDMSGIYGKNIDKTKAAEDHIFTMMNTDIGIIDVKNGRIAADVNNHLSVSDMSGNLSEITDGDSRESGPSWSKTDDRLFCSTSGIARNEWGAVAAAAPSSVIAVDLERGTMEELFSDENYDFLRPQNDCHGNFYYIKQPYKIPNEKPPLWKDILLFPVRIIKAVGGFLNAFSVIFGGESLRSGKNRGDVKTKQKSDRELYFEGRLIEAEKNEKENSAKGEKNPGILPASRVLVRNDGGTETVIKRGVLDYTVLDDGSIICSNGKNIIHVKGDGEEVIVKAKLAHSICVIE